MYLYITGEANLVSQLFKQQYSHSRKQKLIPKCRSDSKSLNADQQTTLIFWALHSHSLFKNFQRTCKNLVGEAIL